MALFGEKYGDEVRVLSFGDFSTELCGGTHVGRTGDIGLFKITGEGGIASGIRRIEAVTGEGALEAVRAAEATLKRVAGALRATPAELEGKVAQLLEQQKKLEREISALRSKLATGGGVADLAAQAVKINGVSVLAARIEGADAESLREAADQYKSKLGEAVIVLGAQVADDKVSLVSSVFARNLEEGERRRADRRGGEAGRRPRRRAAGLRAGGRKRPVEARRGPAGRAEARRRKARRNLTPGRQSEDTWGSLRYRFWCCSPGPSRPPGSPGRHGAAARAGRLFIKPVVLEHVSVIAEEPRYVAPTRLDKIGRIWAPVAINGKGPFRLVLATGASHTALTRTWRRRSGIQADPADTVMLRGATGSVAVPMVPVETLEIGDFLMEPRRLAVIPDALGGADGVLGMDGLANKRIHIDFRHDRITIMRSKNQRAAADSRPFP